MKKFFAFFLSAMVLTGLVGMVSCGKEEKAPEKKMVTVVHKAIPDGSYVATGSFNGKYPITMKFTVKGQKLAGQYYYNKYGPGAALDIVGRVDTTFVAIQEFDPNGINSGDFQGNTVTADEISGIFNTHANGKQLPFTIKFEAQEDLPDFLSTVSYANGFDFGPELETFEVEEAKAANLEPGYFVVKDTKKKAKKAEAAEEE